jgi:signal transduction histidine kinase
VPERAVAALGKFARIVSDAAATKDVLSLLADALYEHVCPDGVAVFAFEDDGKLRLAAERGIGPSLSTVEIDLDDLGGLAERIGEKVPAELVTKVTRPLVAAAALYGDVVLFSKTETPPNLGLAEGLIDLAAVALGTAAHIGQLERQAAELRAQQDILVRTEKLRAIGQMAAGISHDLKNILNPLSLHLQIITRSLDRGKIDDAKESAVEMKQALQRGLQTLERLRSFSRQTKDEKTEDVDLDQLAREAVAIGKSRAASRQARIPRLVEELTGPPVVRAVGGEVDAALVNLVVNAIDAGAGTITIRSGTSDGGSWIEVADDGPGMPPEVAKRVFEPFFTTKGEEGTGLGLAMVYATMERCGGTVTIDTKEGKGTTFRLLFRGR